MIHKLICDDNHIKRFRSLKLCTIRKETYRENEISKLKNLANALREGFDKSIETKKVNKMVGSKEVFNCPYCLRERTLGKNCECGKNKFGLNTRKSTPELISYNLIEIANAIESAVKELN